MEQGNPNKVNAIVDEIVKNNSVFKLKSPIEQDKEKDSMARSINSALSVLNEVGKELVLQDLSVDPDEKFKGFIDSVGNIDISGLTKMTATIVKAKIEEAEREGINLRTGESVLKNDNKTLVAEVAFTALTVAELHKIAEDFKNQPFEMRRKLFGQWEDLNFEDRSKVINAEMGELHRIAESQEQHNATDSLNTALNKNNGVQQELSESQKDSTEQQIYQAFKEQILENPDSKEAQLYKYYIETEKKSEQEALQLVIEDVRKTVPNALSAVDEMVRSGKVNNKKIDEQTKQVDDSTRFFAGAIERINASRLLNKLNDNLERYQKVNNTGMLDSSGIDSSQISWIIQQFESADISQERLNEVIKKSPFKDELEKAKKIYFQQKEKKEAKEAEKLLESAKRAKEEPTQDKTEPTPEQKLQQEIEQLPVALEKSGFSQEEIKEALKIYVDFVKEIDDEVIEDFKTKDEKELIGFVKEYFSEYKEQLAPKSFKVLEILASNTFGGQLQQILTNPQLLQETFLPALSAKIEKLEQQPIPDEHTDEYYRSQATTLTLDRNVEEIAKKVQAQGGGVKEITVALAKKVEERATEQSQHSIPEEESKEQKTEQPTPPIFENPTSPEEPTQESATSPEQETLEETGQNTAMVKQDNSFIGKIRRVFANMRDMKNKDNSKGFFARLGTSIKTVFGNKEEHYEEQDSTSTTPTTENQSQSTARREPIDYLNQHFEVNESIARKETEKSKKAKDFSNADDRTTDEEEK